MFGSPHEDFKGMRVKSYNFIGPIGEGGFAKVWQAYNESDGQIVAIKAIPDSMLKQKKIKQLALSEIKIMKALSDNPNIVKFIENFRCSQTVLIVMEHCQGGTLESLLKKQGRFSEEKATNILKHILNGFKGLHQKNVIHRDFKAENVLMKNDIPKIADLGFAKMLTHEGGVTSTCLGTSVTMAPEVHLGQEYGLKADIWSLGVVYYQLIFGRYPYVGKDDYQILNASKHKPNFIGVNLSPKAKDFILKCLTFKQQERISWQQLYNHPLIRQNQKSVYNLGRKQNLLKNLVFYENKMDYNIKVEVDQIGSFQDLSKVEKMKLQKADYEKANARNKQKKQMDQALEKYKKLYLNRRNTILFIFKHIDPHIPSILKMPVNHANYVYILCKNAYHNLITFDKAISTNTNFMKLDPYFQEFTKSPEYKELVDMVHNEIFVVELQTREYLNHVKNEPQSVKEQVKLEKIANKNWPNFVKEIISEYENILMDYLDHFKAEQKKRLIMVIEALSCLRNLKEDTAMDIYDKQLENIKFQEVEAKIRARQQQLLKQFQQ